MKQKIEKAKNNLNKLVKKKNILIMIIGVTILFMIPILWTSFYAVPSADDFSYGKYTMNLIQHGEFLKVIGGSFKTVGEFYKTWQGTYSAIILFSLNPGIYGHNFYFLTTFLITGTYFLSLAYLLKQLLNKSLKLEKTSYWMVVLLFFLLCIETLVDKTQGLYWWNGASYYMIFFSLELVEIALLIKQYFLKEKTKTNTNTILIYILIGIIGGGNFIVALQQIILLFFLNAYLIIFKKDKSAIPYLCVSIFSLLISAVAPGNKERQVFLKGMNPVKAILFSFFYCLKYMKEWISILNIVIIGIIEIILYPTYKKINKKFSYPLVVIFFLYCILSAEFTPTLYSMSTVGEGRLLNIIYISYLFFLSISLYYLIGYIRNVIIDNKITTKNADERIDKLIKENSFSYLSVILIITLGALFFTRRDLTTFQTIKLLKTEEAKVYKEEWNERYKVLNDKTIKEVEFEKLTYEPYPIFFCDFDEDKDNWLNSPATEIYHKDSIAIKKEEKDNGEE